MHTVETIKALLDSNPKAVMRALVVLYNRQTADERAGGHTTHLNGRGFNGYDAKFGTDLAKQVMAGHGLSERQLSAARKMVKKYARQLLEEAEAKASQPNLAAIIEQEKRQMGDYPYYPVITAAQ